MDPYTLHTLDNGLRIVIEQMPSTRSAAAGFLVLTGARDDPPEHAGVSHFLEHMMFKGTAKRSWSQIAVDFDRMGSDYNAYTSEDRTMYYGWVPKDEIDAQIELLADLVRPTIPQEEFDMEKKAVLEEIAMSKDRLEHVAFDFLEEKLFAGHSLAWPILGYERTIEPLKREDMVAYYQRRYTPDNMMLLVAGHVDPQAILDCAERLCGAWKPADGQAPRVTPEFHTGVDTLVTDRFQQQFIARTYRSVSAADERDETAGAMATILGGENSRMFWNIIQTGISPRAGVYHLAYPDCGAMLLYGICQPDNIESLDDALQEEARRITAEKVQPDEIRRVKNKRRTSLAVEAEVPYHRLSQLMDDMEYRGRPRTVDQMLAEVDAVSEDTIQAYLQACPIDRGGHLVSVGPRAWPG